MSYNLSTSFTTALLFGNIVKSIAYPPRNTNQFDDIQALLQTAAALSAHPMVLPSVLLNNHLAHAEDFFYNNLEPRIMQTEDDLGVVRAGRLSWKRDQSLIIEKPIHTSRLNIRSLTCRLNTDLVEVLFATGVVKWDCVAIEFLAKTTEEVARLLPSQTNETREIMESIEYMSTAAELLANTSNIGKERIQAHLSVVCWYALGMSSRTDISKLWSFIAQNDNRLTAKMAASATKDSTAMKTLAFITALFLPGTFIAVCNP
jgi:hypothetical protein